MKKQLVRIGSVLMMLAVLLAFSPVALDGEAYAASIKLSKKTVYMAKGKTYKLKVKGTRAKVKWKSSNTAVVSVSKKGKLKANNYGTAKITAKVKGKTLKCTVKVERKSEKNARTLRNYLLKKGKKKGSTYYIQGKKVSGDGSENTTWTYKISASSKNKILTFDYSKSSDEPPMADRVTLKIDLITGSAAVRTGEFYCREDDGYGVDTWREYYADVTTQFEEALDSDKNTVTGMTLTKYIENDDMDQTVVTDPAELSNPEGMRYPAVSLTWAAEYWNKLLYSKSTLKKAKIKMQTIGFSKM